MTHFAVSGDTKTAQRRVLRPNIFGSTLNATYRDLLLTLYFPPFV
jgi:hypothetical protein